MDEEEWRAVPGSDTYSVSSEGRVRSFYFGRIRPIKCSFDAYGYHVASIVVNRKRGSMKIHRLVLEAFVGPRPPGQECRHLNGIRTDNRLCNLTWGTAIENRSDQTLHNTDQRGERHHAARLTEQQVVEVRAIAAQNSVCNLAAIYGVDSATISDAIRGKTWSYLSGATATRANIGEHHSSAKLTNDQVCSIRKAVDGGASMRRIAIEYGLSHQTVRAIINRKTWRHI